MANELEGRIAKWAQDAGAETVFADGRALLLTPYAPFKSRLSAYYLASNKGYFAAKAMISELKSDGICAQLDEGNVKALLHDTGAAAIGLNTLCATSSLGSYFAVHVIKCVPIRARAYDSASKCTHCGACARACPVGAISESGFMRSRCLRQHMDGGNMTEFAMSKMKTLLGCDICQRVCPRNAHIRHVSMEGTVQALFSDCSILYGGPTEKKARAALVGKNMLTHGRLGAQALVIAANRGDFSHMEVAAAMLGGTECEKSAAYYYIEHANLNGSLKT